MNALNNRVRNAAIQFYERQGRETDAAFVDYKVLAKTALSLKKETDLLKVLPDLKRMVEAEVGLLKTPTLAGSALYFILKSLLEHKGLDIQKIPNLTKEKGMVFKDAAVFPGYGPVEEREEEREEEEEKEEREEEEEEKEETTPIERTILKNSLRETQDQAAKTRAEEISRSPVRVASATAADKFAPDSGTITANGRGVSPKRLLAPYLGRNVSASDLTDPELVRLAASFEENSDPQTGSPTAQNVTNFNGPAFARLQKAVKDSTAADATPGKPVAANAAKPSVAANASKPVEPAAEKPAVEPAAKPDERLAFLGGSRARTRRALLRSIRATLKKNIK